jgi:4-amino-4-deoxy-L-arabinose transferase-like glycosyltransferase
MTVRLSEKLLGHSEVAARMPSTLAMAAGMLITYDCTRRLTNGLHGQIALSLLTCSILPYYGYEARPYALYFMLSALAFWIWTCTSYNSRWGFSSLGRRCVWQ